MINRRRFLAMGTSGLAVPALSSLSLPAWAAAVWQPDELPEGTIHQGILEALPGKVPLIKRSYRPPNFETPAEYFRQTLTRNDAFFVRYHLAGVPTIDARKWRLKVGGDSAGGALEIDFDSLKRDFPAVELVAVCQCSGNRRGLFSPHVPGVEWGIGAMGNARWKGARLRDILNKAGVKKDAVEVAFNGGDTAPMPVTPDFIKSIPIDKALDEHTIVAYEMNGKPLPHWNGFPVRLIVAGWTGTYWMKHLTDLEVRSKPLGGFWMNPAYRVPAGKYPAADPFKTQETPANTPITDIVVNSFVTSIRDGQRYHMGQVVDVAGIAWDGGRGIRRVDVSMDSGRTWQAAELGQDLGPYSFRPFSFKHKADRKGVSVVMVKATNNRGDTQVPELIFNPAGYHHNVISRIQIEVV
jgi:DMSO/TMAO reductase YedYZ molybdopterin-dependent catalytic subunit